MNSLGSSDVANDFVVWLPRCAGGELPLAPRGGGGGRRNVVAPVGELRTARAPVRADEVASALLLAQVAIVDDGEGSATAAPSEAHYEGSVRQSIAPPSQ